MGLSLRQYFFSLILYIYGELADSDHQTTGGHGRISIEYLNDKPDTSTLSSCKETKHRDLDGALTVTGQ